MTDNTADITNLEDLKAGTALAMEENGLHWSTKPMWLTTRDEASPNRQLRVFSGRMSCGSHIHPIDAVSEVIFWFQARRVAIDWKSSNT